MGVIVKQSVKGTLVAFGGTILGYINILILFPLIFSAEQIGLYRILIDAATFFVIFSQLGILNVSIKYFPYFQDMEKKNNGFLFYVLLVPLTGFSILALTFFFFKEQFLAPYAEQAPLLLDYENYLIPLAFFLLLLGSLATYSRSLLKIVVPKIIRDIGTRLVITVGAGMFFYKVLDFNGFVVMMVSGYSFALLALIVYIKYLKQWFIKPDFTFLKRPLLKEMVVFGLFMFLGTGGGIIVAKIDTLMLGSIAGLTSTGIYSIAFFIGAVIELPRRSLSEIATPILATAFKEDNKAKIKELYHKTSVNLLIVGGLFFVGIWSNIDAIFQLIPNSEVFAEGKYVVLFIGLAKLFDMSMGLNAEIITNSKYFRWNIFLMPFLAIIAIITNSILIPIYGITGAALATLISICSYNLIRFMLVAIKLKIQPFSLNTLKVVFSLGLVYGINLLIPTFDHFLVDIAVKSSIILATYAFLILTLKPSENISELFESFKERVTKR
ncbi:MAG TPA: polysaccharide biosynthesis protein [Flavobacteriales bacterium]|nr:polysaccharide biosynthesis protein [Flavobacteriales bacterium]HIO68752.1 polysaccharide biosynthesis protein [Flavobacteriales bacterium]